jgi:hypothetical protein
VSECPAGFTPQGTVCTPDAPGEKAYCGTFETYVTDLSVNGVLFHSGTIPDTLDESDPVALLNRGAWFDGIDDYIEIENGTLNPSFTLDFWIRVPDPNAGN